MKQKSICMKQIIYIVTACVFVLVSPVKAQRIYSLKDCLEEGLQNNYSLRIVHNEEQISKNNATLGNAGYLPTLDFSAGYTGNLDNIETKARATGEVTKNNGVYDQTVNVGLNLKLDHLRRIQYQHYVQATKGSWNGRAKSIPALPLKTSSPILPRNTTTSSSKRSV